MKGRLPSQYSTVARTVPSLKAVGSATAVVETAIAVFAFCDDAAESLDDPLAEPQAAIIQSNGAAANGFTKLIDLPLGAGARTIEAFRGTAKPFADFIFRTAESDLTAIFSPPGTWARATNPLPHHKGRQISEKP
jgi:hypothetical protein